MVMEFRADNIHVVVHAPPSAAADAVLTPDALRFVGLLCAQFDNRRQALLAARLTQAAAFDAGATPHFIQHDAAHADHWQCARVPDDIQDRRVEITGPVDRKMVINGLNSGAKVYMADFEDSTSPTWQNIVDGQVNLRDAVRGTIAYTNEATGKQYRLHTSTATLMVRPRGWHLDEAHIMVNDRVASGALVDFGLYLFHNVAQLRAQGTGPYFYLPKLENHREARLWNDVMVTAQQYLGLPIGTVRATVLLETITAAFEMEEILYELRDHMLGLNCGRWDYLFSYIKKFKHHDSRITPDRSHLTMTVPLMQAYVQRLTYLCHKRGTFAMGGMSASIPIKNDPAANDAAIAKVRADKLREVQAGQDGTWVAHPALVQVALDVFNEHMKTPNQIKSNKGTAAGARVSEAMLLELPRNIPRGEAITSKHLEHGVGIVLAYCEAWLRGIGCIPLHNAMEDAATAEISRAQIWSWRVQGVDTQDDGRTITAARIELIVQRKVESMKGGQWRLAGRLVTQMLNGEHLDDFLTTVLYPHIVTNHQEAAQSKL